MMELHGRLFRYLPQTYDHAALSAFISGPAGYVHLSSQSTESSRVSPPGSARSNDGHQAQEDKKLENFAIYLPGLTEGLFGTDYVRNLSKSLESMRPAWSLVQPVLSSSYMGYGTSSLEKDAYELNQLISFLVKRFPSLKRIVLIGYSTGCQDIVTLAQKSNHKKLFKAAFLHAPISDRFALKMSDSASFEKYSKVASDMVKDGKGNELMPRNADTAPITASRYHSLTSRSGADDLFSSDLSDKEIRDRVGKPLSQGVENGRVLIVFPADDEYVPDHVDKENIARRLCASIGDGNAQNAQWTILPGNHALSGERGSKFVQQVEKYMTQWGLIEGGLDVNV